MQFWLYPGDGGGTKGEVVVGFSLLYWLGKDRLDKKAIVVLVMEFFSNWIEIVIKFWYITTILKNWFFFLQVMTFLTINSLLKTTSSLRGLKITGTGSSFMLILSPKTKQTKPNYFLNPEIIKNSKQRVINKIKFPLNTGLKPTK